ncbi:MAG: hypothetical protein MJY87_03595 [Fibrobacter sp.]|nr:hypothetical protein [Fibrobacter sp.]
MKNSKFVLFFFAALTVTALVACGDDSSSAPTSAPVEDLTGSSSATVVDSILVESADDSTGISSSSVLMNSSSSSVIFIPEPGSSSSVIIPSCGTAVYTEKCIDTEFEGVTCDAIGCHPRDCFEEQKGMEAYSCDGGSVMICDGTRWQYTNCVLPIIGSSSSSVENASSSSAYDPAGANGKPCEIEGEERYVGPYAYVCRDGQLTFSEDLSDPCDADNDCGSSEYPEGWQNEPCSTEDEVRLDETFEYRCVGGKWSIQGYNPNLVDPNAERCRSSEIEGSACDVSGDLSHMSVNGCEFFCYGGKWEYIPPPM